MMHRQGVIGARVVRGPGGLGGPGGARGTGGACGPGCGWLGWPGWRVARGAVPAFSLHACSPPRRV
jgi:hypothetical protein